MFLRIQDALYNYDLIVKVTTTDLSPDTLAYYAKTDPSRSIPAFLVNLHYIRVDNGPRDIGTIECNTKQEQQDIIELFNEQNVIF